MSIGRLAVSVYSLDDVTSPQMFRVIVDRLVSCAPGTSIALSPLLAPPSSSSLTIYSSRPKRVIRLIDRGLSGLITHTRPTHTHTRVVERVERERVDSSLYLYRARDNNRGSPVTGDGQKATQFPYENCVFLYFPMAQTTTVIVSHDGERERTQRGQVNDRRRRFNSSATRLSLSVYTPTHAACKRRDALYIYM